MFHRFWLLVCIVLLGDMSLLALAQVEPEKSQVRYVDMPVEITSQ